MRGRKEDGVKIRISENLLDYERISLDETYPGE